MELNLTIDNKPPATTAVTAETQSRAQTTASSSDRDALIRTDAKHAVHAPGDGPDEVASIACTDEPDDQHYLPSLAPNRPINLQYRLPDSARTQRERFSASANPIGGAEDVSHGLSGHVEREAKVRGMAPHGVHNSSGGSAQGAAAVSETGAVASGSGAGAHGVKNTPLTTQELLRLLPATSYSTDGKRRMIPCPYPACDNAGSVSTLGYCNPHITELYNSNQITIPTAAEVEAFARSGHRPTITSAGRGAATSQQQSHHRNSPSRVPGHRNEEHVTDRHVVTDRHLHSEPPQQSDPGNYQRFPARDEQTMTHQSSIRSRSPHRPGQPRRTYQRTSSPRSYQQLYPSNTQTSAPQGYSGAPQGYVGTPPGYSGAPLVYGGDDDASDEDSEYSSVAVQGHSSSSHQGHSSSSHQGHSSSPYQGHSSSPHQDQSSSPHQQIVDDWDIQGSEVLDFSESSRSDVEMPELIPGGVRRKQAKCKFCNNYAAKSFDGFCTNCYKKLALGKLAKSSIPLPSYQTPTAYGQSFPIVAPPARTKRVVKKRLSRDLSNRATIDDNSEREYYSHEDESRENEFTSQQPSDGQIDEYLPFRDSFDGDRHTWHPYENLEGGAMSLSVISPDEQGLAQRLNRSVDNPQQSLMPSASEPVFIKFPPRKS